MTSKLFEDLKECKKEVFLIINDFNDAELSEILDSHNGIKIFTKSGKSIEHKNVCGLYKTNLEINAVVIDQKILWYGGINPFKTVTYNDSIMRINDKSICETILKEAKKSND